MRLDLYNFESLVYADKTPGNSKLRLSCSPSIKLLWKNNAINHKNTKVVRYKKSAGHTDPDL